MDKEWERENQAVLKEWFDEGKAVYVYICPGCHRALFSQYPTKKYCSYTCGYKLQNREIKTKRFQARANRKCVCCGKEFTPPRSDAKYCSNACRQKAYRQSKV